MSTLSIDAQKRAEKDSKKKEAKAAAAEARAKEAKDQAMITIKRVERNKRKYVTEVSGLEAHGLELKKVAKEWGKKCMYREDLPLPSPSGRHSADAGASCDWMQCHGYGKWRERDHLAGGC